LRGWSVMALAGGYNGFAVHSWLYRKIAVYAALIQQDCGISNSCALHVIDAGLSFTARFVARSIDG
jgi:hypothetical protein